MANIVKHCSLSAHRATSWFDRHGMRRPQRNYGRLRFCHGYSSRNCALNSEELTSPPRIPVPAVISRGTPIDDGGSSISLIPRYSTASARSSSSYGSFLPLGTVTDRGRYKSGSDYVRLSRLSYDLSDVPVELTVIGRTTRKRNSYPKRNPSIQSSLVIGYCRSLCFAPICDKDYHS